MTQEITMREHVGADGVLHLDIPQEWINQDVEVVIKPIHRAPIKEAQKPEQTLAEALEGYIGTVSYDVPENFHERRKELYREGLAEKYERKA